MESASRLASLTPFRRCLLAASAVVLGACSGSSPAPEASSLTSAPTPVETLGPAPVDVYTTLAAILSTTMATAVETPTEIEPITEPTRPILQPTTSPEQIVDSDTLTTTTTLGTTTSTTMLPTTSMLKSSSTLAPTPETTATTITTPEAKKGHVYQNAMNFFPLFADDAETDDNVAWIVDQIHSTKHVGVQPITVLEINRDTDAGDIVESYADVTNQNIQHFFSRLQEQGITADELGRLIVLPEYIAGFSGDPGQYASLVNRYAAAIRGVYPDAHISLMIDTWVQERSKLIPQIGHITEHIDSIGIQSYSNSWQYKFNPDGSANIEASWKDADFKQIMDAFPGIPAWISTGVTGADNNLRPGNPYTFEQRQAVATAMANSVVGLNNAGYNIELINLFVVDKTAKEGRDYHFSATELGQITATFTNKGLNLAVYSE